MMNFAYSRAERVEDAIAILQADPEAKILAGGTNLMDLVKYDVERPTQIVDINRLPLRMIEDAPDGGLAIGALVTNTDVAYDNRIEERYPLLASAILAGAAPQLRNAATTGGNLLQRTRCYYFYDVATPCNKREPGSGCSAITGQNRIHAILGASARCVATHPSDMCVALAALGASVRVAGRDGERVIPFADFHRLPGDRPEADTTLARGEIILGVELPSEGFAQNFTYLKLRDRLSYAFALVSIGAALRLEDGQIVEARLALGGVAHKPWRDEETEAMLAHQAPSPELFAKAADHLLRDAQGLSHNAFKIELARRGVVRALAQAAAGTPQSQSDKRIR